MRRHTRHADGPAYADNSISEYIDSHHHSLRNPDLYPILTNHLAEKIAAPTLKVITQADATLAEANASERVDTANGSGSR
jgi:predicted glycoside hydrolase/deacetylase ChbG (UPF0249 family)